LLKSNFDNTFNIKENQLMTFVLENIRSAWNVGSIFRTCDALGWDIILVGYTPQPVEANMKQIAKTAIGAEKTVNWQHFDHSQEIFDKFYNSKHLAIEISDKSININEYLRNNKIDQNTLLWLGNEIHGVSELVREQADQELHLTMKGLKESLNVASAACAIGYLLEFVVES
jgi:23S rRNA (guanosine2251-2'-O)-methyltransferase